MVMTNTGKSGISLLVAGETSLYPRYCGIGSGSGTALITNTALIAEPGSRVDYTTKDFTVQQETTWTYDFNSVRMSGLNLREFGVFDTQVRESGTMYNRESFGAVNFDGNNELQIQVTYQTF